MGGPLAINLIETLASHAPEDMHDFGKDVLVLVETTALSLIANNVVKFAVGRLRPLAYDPQFDDAQRLDRTPRCRFTRVTVPRPSPWPPRTAIGS